MHQRIPTLVLEGCLQIASGANHTVALAAPSGHNQVFAWGSNAAGHLGLQDACGFSERTLRGSGALRAWHSVKAAAAKSLASRSCAFIKLMALCVPLLP